MNTPNDRNLLDFMDETVDAQGRALSVIRMDAWELASNGTVNSSRRWLQSRVSQAANVCSRPTIRIT